MCLMSFYLPLFTDVCLKNIYIFFSTYKISFPLGGPLHICGIFHLYYESLFLSKPICSNTFAFLQHSQRQPVVYTATLPSGQFQLVICCCFLTSHYTPHPSSVAHGLAWSVKTSRQSSVNESSRLFSIVCNSCIGSWDHH